jgi:hypothetical protein
VSEAEGAVAGCRERGVARAVALEGPAGAVVGPGVGLDEDAVVLEDEVHLEAFDVGVDLRLRQVVVSAEAQEALFELGLGQRGAGRVRAECREQLLGSAVAGVGAGEGAEGGVVGELQDLRLVERAFERSGLEGGGEVEERPGPGS